MLTKGKMTLGLWGRFGTLLEAMGRSQGDFKQGSDVSRSVLCKEPSRSVSGLDWTWGNLLGANAVVQTKQLSDQPNHRTTEQPANHGGLDSSDGSKLGRWWADLRPG